MPQLQRVIAMPLPMPLLRRLLFVFVVLPTGTAAMAQTHCEPSLGEIDIGSGRPLLLEWPALPGDRGVELRT